MAAGLFYDRSDETALITPDALRIRFKQSGFEATLRETEDGLDLEIGDKMALLLSVESGYVSGIELDATFVDKQAQKRARLACELLESMGWVPSE